MFGWGGGKSGAEKMVIEQANDIEAGFIRVAFGVEDGLDVGAFGPFPEELFELGLGFGLLKSEALLLDGRLHVDRCGGRRRRPQTTRGCGWRPWRASGGRRNIL